MIPLSLMELAAALGVGTIPGSTAEGLTTDSRRVRRGDIYVGLKGRQFDGSLFAKNALDAGAACCLVEQRTCDDPRCVVVPDALDALRIVATLVRSRFHGPVVGITGSVGKTTVKEFLRTLFSVHPGCVFPDASHNNFEGLPRTICKVEPDTNLLVLELGTNHPGEIAALAQIARPTLGVLTAIGPAHLEGLVDIEGVASEKWDLLRALPPGSRAILNGDDRNIRGRPLPLGIQGVWAGLEPAEGVTCPVSYSDHDLTLPSGVVLHHALPSKTMVRNLWLALLVGQSLGYPMESFQEAVAKVRPASLRGEERRVRAATIILDCYNANPLSMEAALQNMAARPGRKVLVLGEMLELGSQRASAHKDLGKLVAGLDVELALFIGASRGDFSAGASGASFRIETFASLEEARRAFAGLLDEECTILVKASRGMALERLMEGEAA